MPRQRFAWAALPLLAGEHDAIRHGTPRLRHSPLGLGAPGLQVFTRQKVLQGSVKLLRRWPTPENGR